MILYIVVINPFRLMYPLEHVTRSAKIFTVFISRENRLRGVYGGKGQSSNSGYVRYRSIGVPSQSDIPGTSNHALGDPEAYELYKS